MAIDSRSEGIKYPLLIINLKTYAEALDNAMKIAQTAKRVAKETGIEIVLTPSHLSLKDVSKTIPVFSQSIDPAEPGAHTGSVPAEEVKRAGGLGTLINHSERRIGFEDIRKCVERCKLVGLISCVCAKSDEEAEAIASLKPDMILAEPPELVGGNISVSTARPEIITNSVRRVKKISPETKVLCGAGIKNSDDARKAVELGADGVGVSSGIVKAPDIEKAMRDIAGGLLK
ncbi:MAG: triose-phosphate isomerase [Candidatus Aenigmarchaeota archaeon]|nr:triose-phosphate isomerase [Candidatus Aenigmarchaeota archaeon]